MNCPIVFLLITVTSAPLILYAQERDISRIGLSSYSMPLDTPLVNQTPTLKNPDKALRVSLVHTIVPVAVGSLIIVATFSGLLDFEYYDENDELREAAGEFLLLGAGLTLYGLVVGPSAGLNYAEEYQRAKNGTYLRGAAIGALIFGGFIMSPEIRYPIQLAAMGGYVFSTIHSFSLGPKMVRKYNDRLIKKTSIGIGSAIDGQTHNPTLSLTIHF